MAHKRGLDSTYLQPSRDECYKEFVKAIPELTIDDSERLIAINQKLEEENVGNESLKAEMAMIRVDLEANKKTRKNVEKILKHLNM